MKIVGIVGWKDSGKTTIATKIINTCIKTMKKPINLFIDKDKETTDYLLSFYTKRKFEIEYENDVEYKMIYK